MMVIHNYVMHMAMGLNRIADFTSAQVNVGPGVPITAMRDVMSTVLQLPVDAMRGMGI